MRRVNVDGVIHTIRALAPGMKNRAYGRIVNIASNAAIGTALPGIDEGSTRSREEINGAARCGTSLKPD
jgi:NAD(P)-dependent dehydrogenase (short-subunit alcohol dehydrogenase family)